MDKERLFRFIDKKYASKREMYTALPLGMNADEIWDEVLDNRRSKGVILPIRNAAGQTPDQFLLDSRGKAPRIGRSHYASSTGAFHRACSSSRSR